jgi:hypothetical protein
MRIIAAVLWVVLASQAQATCRQALALGLDVSGSVDAREYRLQMDGVAGALMRPEVRDAILAFPDAPIRLYVFEWAGPGSVRRVVGWTELADHADVAQVADILRRTTRLKQDPSTAIGQAMLHGANSLLSQRDCWRFTLDLSGDGESNAGPRPRSLRQNPEIGQITINALVIGSDAQSQGDRRQAEIAALLAYFKNEVIQGEDAFVDLALGFEDFENAMARKLLKELASIAVSQLDRPVRTTP